MDPWFQLHLSDDKARTMNRRQYYAARSWLRRVQHILRLRYAAAHIDPAHPNRVNIPATADILPKDFK